ncbi:MAG: hypothetical protein AAGA42_01635 [Actinomycetota bacterium]
MKSTWTATAIVWVARVAWLGVAVFGGIAVEAALDGRSDAVSWVSTIGGWALWALVALALAIASVRSLTAARLLVPLGVVATIAVMIGGAGALQVAALGLPVLIATFAVFTAEFGRQFVQASAYGDEERFPLRAPAAAGAAAVITWVVWAACLVAGPLLLAARSWIAGGALSVLAVAGAVYFEPRWHRLAQRWLVLVPAGVVVHDPVVLADTVTLRTAQVTGIRLAPADTGAADLTGPASGYAVEIELAESITAVYAFTPSAPNGTAIHLTAMLVAPTRPGETLAAADRRGLPVR